MSLRKKRLLWVGFFIIASVFIGNFTFLRRQAMAEESSDFSNLKMSYRLEGAYSPYKYIQIEVSVNGKGKLDYELYKEYVSENARKQRTIFFRIDESTIKELISLYEKVNFCNLKLNDLNKNKTYVTDVGTTTLTYNCKGQETRLSYTHLKDNPLKELVKFYSLIARRYLPPIQ